MPAAETEHGLAPAEQYLTALWRAKWLFLAIVVLFVAGALLLTALLPKRYASQALLSVRPSPRLESAATLYSAAVLGVPSLKLEDPNDQREPGPRRFVRRLEANRTVTLAAQDAGILPKTAGLDERQIHEWVDVQDLEKTDLVTLTVTQPTAEGAQRFAERLLTRAMEFNREENASAATREFLSTELEKADSAMKAAEARFVAKSDGSGASPSAGRRVVIERVRLDLDLARDAYSSVRKRLAALDLILAEQQLQLTVVDPPTLAIRPSFPRPLLNVSIGLILGILVATVMVVLRSIFDPRA